MTQQTAPIWLKMKPDYIDENFENVVVYLSDPDTEHDNFFYLTLQLLDERVQLALDDNLKSPLWLDDSTIDSEQLLEQHVKYARLYISFLLSCSQEHVLRSSVICSLLYHIMCIEPSASEELLRKIIECCTSKYKEFIKFYWDDVVNFQPSILVHRIINTKPVGAKKLRSYALTERGHLVAEKGYLAIAPTPNTYQLARAQQTSSAIAIANDSVRIYVENNLRLRKTQLIDIEKVEEWVEQMARMQMEYKKPQTKLKQHALQDEVPVVIISTENQVLRVRTVKENYEDYEVLEGTLDTSWGNYKNALTYDYRTSDFVQAWKVGDVIEARVENADKGRFAIYPQLLKCHNEDDVVGVNTIIGKQTRAYAAAIWEASETTQGVRWITEDGYVLMSFCEPIVNIGDYWEVHVDGIKYENVLATPEQKTNDIFDPQEAKARFLENYVFDTIDPTKQEKDEIAAIDIKSLYAALMLCQRQMHSVEERYKILCVMRMLSLFIHQDMDAQYIAFLQSYLKNLAFFARDTRAVSPVEVDTTLAALPQIELREKILRILSQCGDANATIDMDELQGNLLLLKLARLVQAYNNLLGVESDKIVSFIRREIASVLAIETEPDADLDDTQGIILGNESSVCEYKTSIVFPPDNQMQPAPQVQVKNICRGLCAFMNSSTGGKLYLGVNDGGVIQGVAGDMTYLRLKTIDSYIRYVQEQIKPYFPDSYTCLDFKAEYDNQVVVIDAKPYMYGVVHMEEVAYYRWGASNRPMTAKQIEVLANERLKIDSKQVKAVLALQEAIRSRRQVVLHGYASSNSNTQRDRSVEAFAMSDNKQYVYCYELGEDGEGRVKSFSVARIHYVEISDKAWQHEAQHTKPQMDIFHMTGTRSIHVVLELDQMACNLLVEEYPLCQNDLTKNEGLGTWTLDTNIHHLSGAGRFCIGLWEHITIHEGDELKQYVISQAEKIK